MSEVRDIALAAKEASALLARTTTEQRNAAVRAMAQALREHCADILEANAEDMRAGRESGMSEGLLDRLQLTEARVEAMASALEDLAALPDPVGRVIEQRSMDGGMTLQRVAVPIGVVAMVYEARPNVTADAAGICLKTANACVLRGGSQAVRSNIALTNVLRSAACEAGMPEHAICAIETTDRSATDELMSLHGIVDVLIPRGGAGLIQHCVEHAKVPVIETGTGNCHTYIHETADLARALAIVINAKTQRTGVCNACESLLVDQAAADRVLPALVCELAAHGVLIHADARTAAVCAEQGLVLDQQYAPATDADWGTEYLALEISIKCVEGVEQAIAHINRYGTHHSECIVADEESPAGEAAIEAFLAGVDAAAVYANVSTRFTDGGCFGLGAEIGISTQKLHVRGPFALDALTSYKYVIRGAGQTRG